MKRIAIFASGTGSNASRIIEYFKVNKQAEVSMLVCNNPKAGVIEVAKKHSVELVLVDRDYFNSEAFLQELSGAGIDLIVLAGFLWLLPAGLTRKFHNRIVNIHPALLPKYGGKGMYGKAVHLAVLAAREQESGISVHYVNERYDEGELIFQARCELSETDTVESIEQKVRQLEMEHYPKVIEEILKKL